ALAEGLQVRPDLAGGVLLGPEPRLLLALGRQDLPPARDLRATLLQLGDVKRLRLVRVEQAPLLSVELAQLRLPLSDPSPGRPRHPRPPDGRGPRTAPAGSPGR